jgi:hypothetical protein
MEPMTIGELVKALQALPDQTAQVVMSQDEEGNGYSPLAELTADYIYRATHSYQGDVYPLDDEDEEYEAQDGDCPCVILWPVN